MIHRDFHRKRMDSFLSRKLADQSYPEGDFAPPSLTISRQCGSGTSRIGRALVEYLDSADESAVHGWAFFDQSLIGKIIEDHKLPEESLPYRRDHAKFPIPEMLEKSLSLPTPEWTLFNYAASSIRTLCRLGNAIVVGRAGNFVTADLENTFHVRLIGSESRRVASTRNRFQISQEEAEKLVEETDHARSRFVRRYAGAEPDDPRAYHLILNTDNLPDDVLVRIIGDSLVEWSADRESSWGNGGPARLETALSGKIVS